MCLTPFSMCDHGSEYDKNPALRIYTVGGVKFMLDCSNCSGERWSCKGYSWGWCCYLKWVFWEGFSCSCLRQVCHKQDNRKFWPHPGLAPPALRSLTQPDLSLWSWLAHGCAVAAQAHRQIAASELFSGQLFVKRPLSFSFLNWENLDPFIFSLWRKWNP